MSRRKKPKLDDKLLDGALFSSATFEAELKNTERYMLIEVYDDKYKEMGFAITQVMKKYQVDRDGAYVELRYLGIDNQHYRWYIENEGTKDAFPKDALHHLCRTKAKDCKNKIAGRSVIHCQRWRPFTEEEAHETLVSWGYPGLTLRKVRDEKGNALAPRVRQSLVGAAAKVKPAGTARGYSGGGHFLEDEVDYRGDDDDDDDEEEEFKQEDEEPPRSAPVKTKTEALKTSNPKGGSTALDTMLDGGLRSRGKSELNDRLSALRTKLQAKGTSKSATTMKPGGILAQRAKEAQEKKVKKKKKRKAEKELAFQLAKAVKPKKRKRDDSEAESSQTSTEAEDDEDDLGGGGSSWERKKRRYKKIADENPGKLLLTALEDMQEHLGSYIGEPQTGEEKMSPIVTRYLMSVILPTVGHHNISPQILRELRTLSMGLDLLLKGKSDSCGDVMIQRFKSLAMQLRDNSEKFGPHLELLPEDLMGTGSNPSDSAYARQMAYQHAKTEALMSKASGKERSPRDR